MMTKSKGRRVGGEPRNGTRFGYKLNVAGMLSIHSPDYVLMVLVSIFISKTHNYFLSAIQVL